MFENRCWSNMPDRLEAGEYRYVPTRAWAKPADGYVINDVAGVAVDRHDRVYAFCRGPHPVMVFERDGSFVGAWGQGHFKNPHAISLGFDDTLFCTDEADHCVKKFTLDGRLLMTLGTPGVSEPVHSGKPFNRCTHTALSPEGDIYVTDGYGNSRVHKYSPEGRHLLSWGEPGMLPGQFSQPHNIVCDEAGLVYVADREAHRIQVFDGRGKFQGQWGGVFRPAGLAMPAGKCPHCYVTEMAPHTSGNAGWPNIGPRVSILDHSGAVVARLGAGLGIDDDQFLAPHGIAVDSHGDIYVAELSLANWERLFPGQPRPAALCGLRKLSKIPAAALDAAQPPLSPQP
jgi:DNA-binding beta-propeller fold protein YncE